MALPRSFSLIRQAIRSRAAALCITEPPVAQMWVLEAIYDEAVEGSDAEEIARATGVVDPAPALASLNLADDGTVTDAELQAIIAAANDLPDGLYPVEGGFGLQEMVLLGLLIATVAVLVGLFLRFG